MKPSLEGFYTIKPENRRDHSAAVEAHMEANIL